jgi:hypothetical protein
VAEQGAIMSDRELMQQALDALKLIDEAMPFPVAKLTIKNLSDRLAQPNEFQPDWDAMAVMVAEQQRMAKRIEELEAQPEQEPVAWMFQHDETGRMNYVSNDGIHNPTMFLEMNPRYALVCPLYTSPPQRKPLTDDLYNELLFAVGNKCPNETRHQTALRYILQTEKGDEKAAHGIKGDA